MMFSFIETKLFTRLVQEYLSDDEYRQLQKQLMEDPLAGDVIKGSGGIRKLRWQRAGGGKRGGFRVIYFLKNERGVIWMLTMYPKNVKDDLPPKILKRILEEVEDA